MHYVEVIHDYESSGRYFLELRKGEILLVLEHHSSGWWTGKNMKGDKGVFPSTYIRDFTLDPPSDALISELVVIQLSKRFSVDFTTHIPLPLGGEEKVTTFPHTMHPKTPPVHIEPVIDALLLERESARGRLQTSLRELAKSTHPPHQERHETGGDTDDPNDETLLQLGMVNHHMHLLDVRQKQLHNDICSCRDALMRGESVIPFYVCRHIAAYFGNPSGKSGPIQIYREALHARLQRFHIDVQSAESKLSSLQKQLHEAECLFKEGKQHLSHRVQLRDSKVCAFLQFWLMAAEDVKKKYLGVKAQSHQRSLCAKEEENQLRERIRKGREHFIEVEDDYRRWKSESNVIRRVLEERKTLKLVGESLHRMKKEEMFWVEKLELRQPEMVSKKFKM